MGVLTVSCEKEAIDPTNNSDLNNESVSIDKMEIIKTLIENNEVSKNPNVSINSTELCGETWHTTHNFNNSFSNSDYWDYYHFNGTAGDLISIAVTRITSTMDPGFSLFFGTSTATEGVTIFDGGENMTFLEWRDDEIPMECYGDPFLENYVLPSTGTYTIAVMDVQSCGYPLFDYEIRTWGINCDIQGTVEIDGCDTGVTNAVTNTGSTMQHMINLLEAETYRNHGQFVRAVAKLTNTWSSEGLLTPGDKGKIMGCAGQSSIGKK